MLFNCVLAKDISSDTVFTSFLLFQIIEVDNITCVPFFTALVSLVISLVFLSVADIMSII